MLATSNRANLFRLLGDEDRLRMLALCSEEELTVGELAALLADSQPQVTKKTQPLREAGLLAARREGNRTLLRTATDGDSNDQAIVAAALSEGRSLCARDGSLAKVATIVAQREEASHRYFAESPSTATRATDADWLTYLPVLAPLLPGNALVVDIGTGDGQLLPLLSPLFDRVVAVDRSPARLAQCASRIATLGLANIRLREGDAADVDLLREVESRGGANLVVMMRVLHHVARPEEAVQSAARLVRRGGHLLLVDYVSHDNERLREQGDVWLGFEPARLTGLLTRAGLDVQIAAALPTPFTDSDGTLLPGHQLAIAKKPTAN